MGVRDDMYVERTGIAHAGLKKKRAADSAALVHSLASGHWSPARHETVDDHDKRDHQEKVDYSTDVDHEGTEEPKDEQDDGDRPEHACPLSEFFPCNYSVRRDDS